MLPVRESIELAAFIDDLAASKKKKLGEGGVSHPGVVKARADRDVFLR